MQRDTTRDVAFLLAEAAAAHEQFERAALRGRRDPDRPEWCAEHAMAHGLDGLTEDSGGGLSRLTPPS